MWTEFPSWFTQKPIKTYMHRVSASFLSYKEKDLRSLNEIQA